MLFNPICKPEAISVQRNSDTVVRWYRAYFYLLCVLFCAAGLLVLQPVSAQTALPLTDLSSFKDPGPSWQIVGDVNASLTEDEVLTTSRGKSILVNMPGKKNVGKDLFTKLEHGDADLELDYMMAKGSNSGIYLQGRYEIQLLDSWGKVNPTAGDNGGVYERWDESKPDGQKGYQGYAPRQNVSQAPGLWQHMKISFQAPRFDAQGNKIENAKMSRVELNGVTIHENVELLGPTRGAMGGDEEVAKGPIRIQGDHGAIAFKNIMITSYDKPRPELTDLKYSVYHGRFEKEPDYKALPPEAEGSSVILTSDLRVQSDSFLIRYQGNLHVAEPGEYTFNLNVPGGGGLMRINNKEVVPLGSQQGKVTLSAGDMPFELLYSKFMDWVEPGLGLSIAGPGIREYLISDGLSNQDDPVDPILIEVNKEPILRSFMDIPDGPRVTHAITVGSQQQVHYTYDLDHGALVQVWRGDYLDATPMWHQRGDGSSRPVGAIQYFGKPQLTIAQLSSEGTGWVEDTTSTSYRPKGYVLDAQGKPTFRYTIYGSDVSDAVRVTDDGKGIQRTITVENPADKLYARLAAGSKIQEMENGMYLVDDKAYYLNIEDAGDTQPIVRDAAGMRELIVPVQNKLTYSILF